MSNEPSRNYLFAADIGPDAKLTLRNAYYTGGKGGHSTGPLNNALFSQNSVIVSKAQKVVILVNAGSNTLSMFQINPKNPSDLKLLGKPVYSGGDFPISVAINKAGDTVCALNTGAVNGVSCFQLDTNRGLAPLPGTTRSLNLPQTARLASGPDMTASMVEFTDDGNRLVVAVKGSMEYPKSIPGFIAVWSIYKDRSLSAGFTPIVGGIWPWSLTQVPGTNAFVSGDGVAGIGIYDLDAFPLGRQAAAAAVREFTVQGQGGICWSVYSNATGNFYLVDLINPAIDEFRVNSGVNGTVVASHPLNKFDGPSDISIAHVNGKDQLYLLVANTTSIAVLTIEGPGKLQRTQNLNIGGIARRAHLAFDARNNVGIATYVV
ncbi:hypothetical protein AX15_004104 [Amanita polypyramis BW_CC]|nr:hypothetical protein AX15_004104 [Amanita polypyramis BW_CC]